MQAAEVEMIRANLARRSEAYFAEVHLRQQIINNTVTLVLTLAVTAVTIALNGGLVTW